MYKTLNRTLTGISPILLHNGRLANPLDPMSKAMKEVSAKKKKTDDDHKLMSDIEWLGSIYTASEINVTIRGYNVAVKCDGPVCIPGDNISSMLALAGAKSRRKQAFTAGVLVDGDFPLQYSGPSTLAELFAKPAYRYIKGCRIGQSRVMRTRPIFRSWSLQIAIQYLSDLLNPNEVDEALTLAGAQIGLCDYRPRYGRFSVQAA